MTKQKRRQQNLGRLSHSDVVRFMKSRGAVSTPATFANDDCPRLIGRIDRFFENSRKRVVQTTG